ncbi:MAG: hypothetical protein KTR30_23515 [Saprospiraceae bacterium]|nr:hypothetical protein [Saprospiraceae bacterium]
MDSFGLIAELVFFGMGVYFLLLSFGKIKLKKQEDRERIEAFFAGKTWFLRILAIFLVLVMGLNLIVHISQLMG